SGRASPGPERVAGPGPLSGPASASGQLAVEVGPGARTGPSLPPGRRVRGNVLMAASSLAALASPGRPGWRRPIAGMPMTGPGLLKNAG
ncbi:MAG: hypothetical protein ACYCVZ_10210, partial [Streptosporangiaceae bacterium]